MQEYEHAKGTVQCTSWDRVEKRYLLVEDETTDMYIIESLRDKFDDVLILSDFISPVDGLPSYEADKFIAGVNAYSSDVTTESPKRTKILNINKKAHIEVNPLILEDYCAYFVVGKNWWYYLRDLHESHIGLRNTNLDWQIVHLEPYTLGKSKLVFSHTMSDEHYRRHMQYFFDDEKLSKRVVPLPAERSKTLKTLDEIKRALSYFHGLTPGTLFGLDYETNGLWKYDLYEKVKPVGVGISTKDYAAYFEFRYLTDDELKEFVDLYKAFLDKHIDTIYVFNVDFEMTITRKLCGDWAIYDFKDADIFRIIYGDQVGYSKKVVQDMRYRGQSPKYKEISVRRDQRWSLKYTAQKQLGVGSWDDEFEELEGAFFTVFGGYQHDNIYDFLSNPILGPKFHEWVSTGRLSEKEATRILKGLCAWKKMRNPDNVIEVFGEGNEDLANSYEVQVVMFGVRKVEELENHPSWIAALEKYPEYATEFNTLVNDPRWFGSRFTIVPSDIMGEYCNKDSYYTVMLAEKFFAEDQFTYDAETHNIAPEWMTTKKLVDIFAGNKAAGAKLDLYGLRKSNSTRDRMNDILFRSLAFSSFVLTKAQRTMVLSRTDLSPHEHEKFLHPVFKSLIRLNRNPLDFGRATKVLFPEVFDDSCEFKWSDEKAEKIFGSDGTAEEMKDILLSHSAKGFINAAAFSRSINVHKETGDVLEELWNDQELPEDFDWTEVRKYYDEMGSRDKLKESLNELNKCNLRGKTLDEILTMPDEVHWRGGTYTFREMYGEFKSEYNIRTSIDELGILSQVFWRDYKSIVSLYHPFEYKDVIDNIGIIKEGMDYKEKISLIKDYLDNVISEYKQPAFVDWEDASLYAKEQGFPEELCSPTESMDDVNQKRAYISSVISEDVFRQFKVTKNLLDQYVWYRSITDETTGKQLEDMHASKGFGALSFKNW